MLLSVHKSGEFLDQLSECHLLNKVSAPCILTDRWRWGADSLWENNNSKGSCFFLNREEKCLLRIIHEKNLDSKL
jgi:hypothetical protein